MIIQVLDELADNAVEFSAPGDQISIALNAEGHRGSISADNIDGGVEFCIKLPAA